MSTTQREQKVHFQVGAFKQKTTSSGETIFVGSVNIKSIDKLPADMKQKNQAGEVSYFRAIMRPFPDGADQHGNTHYLRVDTFVPTKDFKKEDTYRP